MARFSAGAVGPFQGKVGNLIGATWKGIPYMRSRPVRKAKPTENELLNRNKFAILHNWLKPLLFILRVGFNGYSRTVEGYNAAKSYNLKNALTLVKENYELDPAKILVSYGNLLLPENLTCSLHGRELHFTWDYTNRGDGDHPKDRTLLLAYDPKSTMYPDYTLSGACREEEKDVLKITRPGIFHIYFAFLSDDRTKQSNSCYLGVVEVG
jgi:hypothetical protein